MSENTFLDNIAMQAIHQTSRIHSDRSLVLCVERRAGKRILTLMVGKKSLQGAKRGHFFSNVDMLTLRKENGGVYLTSHSPFGIHQVKAPDDGFDSIVYDQTYLVWCVDNLMPENMVVAMPFELGWMHKEEHITNINTWVWWLYHQQISVVAAREQRKVRELLAGTVSEARMTKEEERIAYWINEDRLFMRELADQIFTGARWNEISAYVYQESNIIEQLSGVFFRVRAGYHMKISGNDGPSIRKRELLCNLWLEANKTYWHRLFLDSLRERQYKLTKARDFRDQLEDGLFAQ